MNTDTPTPSEAPDTAPIPAPRTPRKGRALAIYALAFAILVLLEAGRLVPTLERWGTDFPAASQAAELLFTAAQRTGLATLSNAESRLVNELDTDQIIGTDRQGADLRGTAWQNAERRIAGQQNPGQPGAAQNSVLSSLAAPKQNSPQRNLPGGLQMSDNNLTSGAPALSKDLLNPVAAALDQLRDQADALKAHDTLTGQDAQKQEGAESPTDPANPQNLLNPEDPEGHKAALADGKTKVMIVGDSMIMEGFGPVLQRALRARTDLDVVREGKYSTGLTRPDQLDWPEYLKTLLEKHQPEVIIVCLGANDPQDIIDNDQKRHIAGSPSWQVLYKARAEAFLRVAQSQGASVIWSGLPVMGKETYDNRIRILSDLQRQACEAGVRCAFVDNRKTLAAPDGSYLTFTTDAAGKHVRLRYKDKIHVTEDGGRLLAAALLPTLDATLKRRETARTAAEHPVASTRFTRPEPALVPTGEELRRAPARVEKLSFRSHFLDREVIFYAFVPGKLPLKKDGAQAGSQDNAAANPLPSEALSTAHSAVTASQPESSPMDRLPVDRLPMERFPVVYLLHGAGGGADDWKDRAGDLLGELTNRLGLIVVIPTAGPFSWYADSVLNPSSRAESFMIQELIPHAEKQLPTLPQRGIAGVSMGGHGAFVLSFRNPGLFKSVSSMSGIMDITRHPEQWRIKTVLGPFSTNRRLWEQHSAFVLALRQRRGTAPAMLFSTGTNGAWAAEDNRLFDKRLTRLGLSHEYHATAGRHDWTYWREELPRHMAFHARILNAPAPPSRAQ